ncbi:ssl1498 family light-harvesting-like protein [Nostoc sp. FACHB-152]|uniref:photosystem II assembly protein Psb34 n=1 Tax=unclassified Nostoc TaxID=2593658 RepID=UPI00168486FF|nr:MULTISPECIES: ssl1498 family light-harvesting-like protein [unclassified Nostoc]MBD2449010.1 ssl1498 family light-harvesting-like protein [Nostoc sp. FACHB-152]MBD2469740.1 ssl1498 family light-harvesting-like protein [Nostoc sp. FACHB-145]
MRYTDKEGKTLNFDDCKTADSFFMEAEVYICEPLEMYFNKEGDLKAGKKPHKAISYAGRNAIAHLPSNGSELIPSEVQARTHREGSQLLNVPLATGYTVDDEGMINNYAIQPAISLAEYPSTQQQQRYIFQGALAIVFVALTLLTAFAVS